jgi:guanylate kinase
MANQGCLIVLSGPSGCGKSTVCRALLEQDDLPLVLSISATTRPMRPTDMDGVTYHFLTPEAFEKVRAEDGFLEYAHVHGNWYGTPKAEVVARLREGKWVLLEIDVQGALQVKDRFPESILVFLNAPSIEDYERRIRNRGEDSEEVIQRRLAGVRAELAQVGRYDYQVVNREVAQAAEDIRQVLLGHGRKCECSTS